MAVARKIAYNVFASSVSKFLSTILALVSIGFITRYLGKEGFGNYATVLAFLSFFASIADLGLYHISTREISRDNADEQKIIGNIFSLRLISSLLILILSPVFVMFFDYPEEVKRGIIIVAASFVFSSGYQVLNGVFQKNLAMDRVAFAEFSGKIIQAAVIIGAVKLNLGFIWIISSMLFYMAFTFFLVYFLSRRHIRFKMQFDFSYWKKFLSESAPIGIGAVIVFIYFKMDTILLSVMKNSADVGIYNAAYKVLENISFFPTMIIGLILPIMSANIFKNRPVFVQVSDKTFKLFVILTVPLIIGTLFLSEGVIMLIGGGQFSESANVLRILIFALAFIFFGVFFNNILIAANLQKKLTLVWGAAAAMNVFLNLLLIPKFSYLAAAGISAITELLVAGLSFYLVVKHIGYFPKLEKAGGILFSGGIMAVSLSFLKNANFFVAALGGMLVYFFSLWVLRSVRTSEILSLISKKGVQEYEREDLP